MAFDEKLNLSQRTTLGLGGRAAYAEVQSEAELVDALAAAPGPIKVLGGGSNIVVAPGELDFAAISVAMRGRDVAISDEAVTLRVGAGYDWAQLVDEVVSEGWSGIECLAGIPGWVGATPIQNVGAYGQEVCDVIRSVRAYDRGAGDFVDLPNRSCDFAYRDSLFKRDRDRFVVVEVTFELSKAPPRQPSYAQLRQALNMADNTTPGLAQIRDAVLALRRGKSMVLDPSDPYAKSVGSFFVNPVVTTEEADRIAAEVGDPQMPRYPVGSKVKLAAAWLIERAGFGRGYRMGKVGLSAKHTLAIVNYDDADANDVRALSRQIQAGVRERFGVDLQPEPVFWGMAP